MLTKEKTDLFISDVCEMTFEPRTRKLEYQIHGLIEILDATGVGTWPFNTSEQNFMEYMSALAIAVTHLFRKPENERDLFVKNGKINAGLIGDTLEEDPVTIEQPPVVDECQQIVADTAEIVSEPCPLGALECVRIEDEYESTGHTESFLLKKAKFKTECFTAAVINDNVVDIDTATMALRSFADRSDYPLLHHGLSEYAIGKSLDRVLPRSVRLKSDPTKVIDVGTAFSVINDIDKCLADVSHARLPHGMITSRFDSLLGYIPAFVSSITIREVINYSGKLSPKFETAIAVLQSTSMM